MKKTIIRVALSFAAFNDDQLNSFAVLLVVCLKNNPLFPNLPLTINAFTTLQTDFETALTAAATGGPKDTAAKNEAREALIAAMRRMASYVQSVGLDSEADVMSSGFDIIRTGTNNVPATLDAPQLMGLDNSVSAQLQVRLQAVAYAKAYDVQFSSGNGPWQDADVFPNTRNVVLSKLTPGVVYVVRVRAIGGVNRYSDWSPTMSLMAT